MQKIGQNYDWVFILVVIIVLVTFVSDQIRAFAGDSSPILSVITVVGGVLGNGAWSRYESRNLALNQGSYNPWIIGVLTGTFLWVMLNTIIFVVGLILVGVAGQFVQRNPGFIGDKAQFGQYVLIASSAVAAILMSVVSALSGAVLIARSRKQFISALVATLSYVGVSLFFRLTSLLQGDIGQLKIFNEVGWGEVLIGLLMNLSIISLMLWLGVVLVRRRGALTGQLEESLNQIAK